MEKKDLGKCTMYNWYQSYTQTFFCSAFSFSSVLINVTNTFGKTYLTLKMLVSEKVINIVGLMLVFRWAGVNVLAQNKYGSTIYLLN